MNVTTAEEESTNMLIKPSKSMRKRIIEARTIRQKNSDKMISMRGFTLELIDIGLKKFEQ